MDRYLLYNFSGEIDDMSHLFPNERLAQLAGIIRAAGAEVEIWDRGNADTLNDLAPARWKRSIAAWAGRHLFRKLARNKTINLFDKLFYGLPLKKTTASMSSEIDRRFMDFMEVEAKRILDGKYKAVILNLWQGGFDESMRLAELLKAASSMPIYATGQRVDWFEKHILEHCPHLDGILLGLGYQTVDRWVRGEPFESLPDTAFRNASGEVVVNERSVVEVAGLPSPLYEPDVYKGMEGLVPLYHIALSNQACPNRCAFCPRPYNYGRKVRRKPVDEAIAEVEALCAQGVRNFRIADSTPPRRQLTDFARGIVDAGLHERGVTFSAFSRVDQNGDEDFDLLAKARFASLFFGLESLDDEGLKRIRKGITYGEMKASLKRAKAAGLFVIGSVIMPLPYQTAKSAETTFHRLRELSPYLDSVLIQPAGVYPISEWGLHPEEFGILLHPGYVEKSLNYRVKFIIPMRFWKPFPFSYPIMGKAAADVTFDDIRVTFEEFSRRVWEELDVTSVQDYTLLVSRMLDVDSYTFADQVKEVLVTRNYDRLREIVRQSQKDLRIE